MKIKKTPYGGIAIQGTLSTMEVGEKWTLDPEKYSLGYLRTLCSTYGSAVNKSFTVSAPLFAKNITITRNR